MARLIEFFTQTGELVLDPFAGVGGTLLGAAIARGPRRAIGIELDPRWAAVYDGVVPDLAGERDGAGPCWPTSARPTRAGRGRSTSGAEMRVGDALAVLPTIAADSIDLVATDPPYNVQLPMTMAGGPLSEAHANRRTDYAMISDSTADLANSAGLRRRSSTAWSVVFGELCGCCARRYAMVIVRDAYQDGRYLFTGVGPGRAGGARGVRPEGYCSGRKPARDAVRRHDDRHVVRQRTVSGRARDGWRPPRRATSPTEHRLGHRLAAGNAIDDCRAGIGDAEQLQRRAADDRPSEPLDAAIQAVPAYQPRRRRRSLVEPRVDPLGDSGDELRGELVEQLPACLGARPRRVAEHARAG